MKLINLSKLRPGDLVFTNEWSVKSLIIRALTFGRYSHVAIVLFPDLWFETDGAGAGYRSLADLRCLKIGGEDHVVTPYKGAVKIRRLKGEKFDPVDILEAIRPNIATQYPHPVYFLYLTSVIGKTRAMDWVVNIFTKDRIERPEVPYCSQLVYRVLDSLYPIKNLDTFDHISPNGLFRRLKRKMETVECLFSACERNISPLPNGLLNPNNEVKKKLISLQYPHDKERWESTIIGIAEDKNTPISDIYVDHVDVEELKKIITRPRYLKISELFWSKRYR